MRLGQLARSVSLKPKELIEFLEEHEISGYTHANSKMTEEDESFVLQQFGKLQDLEANINSEEVQEVEEESPEAVVEDGSEAKEESEIAEQVNIKSHSEGGDDSNGAEEETVEEVELIKAPKIELQGLKVVGKIDLPDPPKKIEEKEPEDIKSEKRNRENRKDRNRKGRNFDPDYNPIAAKREREKKKKEKQAKIQKQKQKKAKKEFYMSRVSEHKAKSQTKKKPHKPASYSEIALQNDKKAKSASNGKQNLLSRFWKWLNTY